MQKGLVLSERSESNGFTPILIVLLIAVLGVGGYFVYTNYFKKTHDPSVPPNPIVTSKPTSNILPSPSPNLFKCIRDVKQCADGSFVVRNGPNCQFASCPADSIPGLDSVISYEIPKGWTKNKYPKSAEPDPYSIYLESSDYSFNERVGYITNGAQLKITVISRDQEKTLEENIRSLIPYSKNESEFVPIQIGGIKGFNKFLCIEFGCPDFYYVPKENVFWQFGFECAPNCETKPNVDNNKYVNERDSFLNSIRFK